MQEFVARKGLLVPSGNVGIGTTSPAELLHLQSSQPVIRYTKTGVLNWKAGVITGNDYAITADNIATTALTIQSSTGNVGIGTNSPIYSLDVHSNQGAYTSRFYQPSTATNTYNSVLWSGANSSVIGYVTTGGSTVANSALQNNFGIGTQNSYPLVLLTNDTERMRITSAGNVLMGTTINNNYRLGVESATGGALVWYSRGDANAQTFLAGSTASTSDFYITVGNSQGVHLAYGTTSWAAYSDERLKNINNNIDNAVNDLMTLKAVNFSWKSDSTNKENLGLIAQDVEKVFPQIVDKSKKPNSEDKTEYLSVRYTELVPVLVKAIQELKQELEILKNK